MVPQAGILYVTMQPMPGLAPVQFHDWYNNEHGPTRLRYPFFANGFRYRATDLDGPGKGLPEWMAIYDVIDMAEMTKEPYMGLRMPPVQSQRERDTMKQIAVDRRFYNLVGSYESKHFKRLEAVNAEGDKNVFVCVFNTVHPGTEEQLNKWYTEEHIPMLSKVPGWLRSRRFVTSSIDGKKETEYFAIHEYAPTNGLDGREFKAARSTSWYDEIQKNVVSGKRRRTYDLVYTFGPAQRDLANLSEAITSTSGKTKTFPASKEDSGAIESYITTKDGAELPYRLEGSTDEQAPLIVLCNSVLVDWGIWDGFVSAFFSSSQNSKYRILRYLSRGRSSQCGNQKVTLDVLTSDVITILDALRVPKAAAVIGVSLGGATALSVGLKYPSRAAAFVSCDTSSKSPAGNSKAWGDRIAVAEKEAAVTKDGEAIVGERLAEMTVRRWFVPESYDGGDMEREIEKVKMMVQRNNLEGFKKGVVALFDYDMTSEMKLCKSHGMFLVGGGDGVLPAGMKKMAAELGNGAECVVIDGAGHLPMVEKPQEVAAAVTNLLESR